MFTLDYRSRKPLYDQLCQSIERMAACGVLEPGSRLPSVRMLAEELAINPNTVQKAFRLLEDEGLVTSRAGAKSYIQAAPEQIAVLRRELLETELQTMVDAARRMGLTREEAHRLLDTLYDKEGTDA